jgi:TPR repeat protein
MAAMMRRMGVMLIVGVAAFGSPASAQFYDLDGAYRCLKTPDPACEKDLQDRPAPPVPPAPPPKPNEPSFGQVLAHVREKTAGPGDIEVLARLAEANDARAVEVLAWCKLNGIGGARDPVAAYWLYRQAAGLEVPHARENQISIFERQLSPEQRQEVLTGENKR